MFTFWVLKKTDLFGYNDTGLVHMSSTALSKLHEMEEQDGVNEHVVSVKKMCQLTHWHTDIIVGLMYYYRGYYQSQFLFLC